MTELIEKAKNGNRKAIEKIYKSTCDELFCYCCQLCGNEHDAEDLMQDTYLTVFEKIKQYRRDDNFKGWLHTIALHKFYNKLRVEKPQLRTYESEEPIEAVEEIYAPETYAEKKELQKILTEIISESLSKTQRLTVTLYYYDEMSVQEISKKLDCPEGTVKTRLYHSRKILKNELLKRGIVLGGSTVLVSAALKSYSETFSASAAVINTTSSVISKGIASSARKSVIHYAKGKIIVGAAAIAVAGGAAGIYHAANNSDEDNLSSQSEQSSLPEKTTFATINIPTTIDFTVETTDHPTEASTGISEPGGEPLEYKFYSNNMTVNIPEKYIPSKYFKTKNSDGGFDFVTQTIREVEIKSRTFLGADVKSIIKFRPDTFSGDEAVFMFSFDNPEGIEINSELSSLYSNISVSSAQQFSIPVDNTNSPTEPTEKAAQRYSFTAEKNNSAINGTVIVFKGNSNKTHIIVLSDCSGTRKQEYENIINSICLSYSDISWRDDYNIPER